MTHIKLTTPSFEFAGSLPLVTAKVDGENKQFLLDNGIPSLVLNSKYDNSESTPLQAFSSSGEAQNIQSRFAAVFEWEDMQLENQLALMMDLSHYEKDANTTIHGIIGGSMLMTHDLLLDYRNKKVGLLNLPDNPPNLMETVAPSLIGKHYMIPLQMAHHLPVIPLKIGDKVLNMALNMGNRVNIISQAHRDYIQQLGVLHAEYPAKKLNLIKEEQVMAYSIESSIIGVSGDDIPLHSMKFAFDIIEIPGASVDGSLGYELFSGAAAIIRYNRRELLYGVG